MRYAGFMIAAVLAATTGIATASPKPADKKQAAALDLVRGELKDGESARFKGVKPLSKDGNYCGFVNSKNSFGAYAGFSVFYVYGTKVIIIPPEQSNPDLCS